MVLRYRLEVCDWDAWATEKLFSVVGQATSYAIEHFSHNHWRVVDLTTNQIVKEHDPSSVIEADAAADIQRFADTRKWRVHFARMAEADRMAQERERSRTQRPRGNTARRGNLDIQTAFQRLHGREFVDPTVRAVDWRKEGF